MLSWNRQENSMKLPMKILAGVKRDRVRTNDETEIRIGMLLFRAAIVS